MSAEGSREPVAPTPSRRFDSRWKMALTLAIVGAFLLGFSLGGYLSTSQTSHASACTGQRSINGNLVDREMLPLFGVIVVLQPEPPGNGVSATVTSSDTGSWTALVSGGCPYDAAFYWQSADRGPLLAIARDVPSGLDIQLSVASHPEDLVLFAEHPDATNVTITANVTAGVVFSVPAVRFGNVSLGFLPAIGPGEWGANFTLPQDVNFSTNAPEAIEVAGAEVYWVQDAAGDWAVYALPATGTWNVTDIPENLTVGQGMGLDYLQGLYPYLSICSHCGTTQPMILGNGAEIWSGTTTPAFNASLQSFISRPAGTSVNAKFSLVNSGPSNNYYVIYQGGADLHVWFCGSGNSVPPYCAP